MDFLKDSLELWWEWMQYFEFGWDCFPKQSWNFRKIVFQAKTPTESKNVIMCNKITSKLPLRNKSPFRYLVNWGYSPNSNEHNFAIFEKNAKTKPGFQTEINLVGRITQKHFAVEKMADSNSVGSHQSSLLSFNDF